MTSCGPAAGWLSATQEKSGPVGSSYLFSNRHRLAAYLPDEGGSHVALSPYCAPCGSRYVRYRCHQRLQHIGGRRGHFERSG